MLFALAALIGIVSLVCWIVVLVKIFQSGSIGLGILGIICPLFTFIYGWVNVDKWSIRNVMILWSIAVVLQIVISLAMPHAVVVTTHTSY